MQLNIDIPKQRATQELGAECIDAKCLRYGYFHEVFALSFCQASSVPEPLKSPGYRCIAKSCRTEQDKTSCPALSTSPGISRKSQSSQFQRITISISRLVTTLEHSSARWK